MTRINFTQMTRINLMSLAFEPDRFQLDHLIIHNVLQPLVFGCIFVS